MKPLFGLRTDSVLSSRSNAILSSLLLSLMSLKHSDSIICIHRRARQSAVRSVRLGSHLPPRVLAPWGQSSPRGQLPLPLGLFLGEDCGRLFPSL